jgi:hypothetical protein
MSRQPTHRSRWFLFAAPPATVRSASGAEESQVESSQSQSGLSNPGRVGRIPVGGVVSLIGLAAIPIGFVILPSGSPQS